MFPDAEVLAAAVAAVTSNPHLAGCSVTVRVSHAALLAACLQHIGAAPAAQPLLVHELTRLALEHSSADARNAEWPAVCRRLKAHGVSHGLLGRCKPLVLQRPSEPAGALEWLATALPLALAGSAPMQAALAEVAALLAHLDALGLASTSGAAGTGSIADGSVAIIADPFMPPPAAHFRGIAFQVFVSLPPAAFAAEAAAGRGGAQRSGGAAPMLICHGGRYDALLAALWRPASSAVAAEPPLRATGATLNVDRLVSITARLRAARAGANTSAATPRNPAPSQAEVLVCARGSGGMLRERVALLQQLRAAGIAAETLPRAAPSLQEQYAYAHAHGVRVLVTLGPEFVVNDCVKVRGGRVPLCQRSCACLMPRRAAAH